MLEKGRMKKMKSIVCGVIGAWLVLVIYLSVQFASWSEKLPKANFCVKARLTLTVAPWEKKHLVKMIESETVESILVSALSGDSASEKLIDSFLGCSKW